MTTRRIGTKGAILDRLGEGTPTELWTVAELAEELGFNEKQIENAVYNIWIAGFIQRHKEGKLQDNGFKVKRYALKIKEADREIYVKTSYSVSDKSSNGAATPKKRKGQQATAKEVRMLFAEISKMLMRIEDTVMNKMESVEDMEKDVNRIKNMLK